MNTASRLQQVAPIGGIVVGRRTFLATREVFDYEALDAVTVKGKAEPIPIWGVRGSRSEQERPPLAPMIGRARELQLLATLWDKVRADRRPQIVTVIGPPGIGKSRLLRELQPTLEADGVFLKGRCRPYGETTGFGAFGQQVQLIDVALQQVLGALVILHHQAIDLSIDRLGGQLAVITVLRNLPA